jgi:hypothetical protein
MQYRSVLEQPPPVRSVGGMHNGIFCRAGNLLANAQQTGAVAPGHGPYGSGLRDRPRHPWTVLPAGIAQTREQIADAAAAIGRPPPPWYGISVWCGLDADASRARRLLAEQLEICTTFLPRDLGALPRLALPPRQRSSWRPTARGCGPRHADSGCGLGGGRRGARRCRGCPPDRAVTGRH